MRGSMVVFLALASCEALVGADFDDKKLDEGTTTATGGAGGTGGASGGTGGTLLPNGSPCDDAAECTSDLCVDSVCCDAACDGECNFCNTEGTEGTCTPLPALTACPETGGFLCDGGANCATGAHRYSAIYGDAANQEAMGCGFRPDGELWVAGHYEGELGFGGGMPNLPTNLATQRVFLARFALDGSPSFQTALGNEQVSSVYDVHDLAVGPDGSVAVVGTLEGGAIACGDTLPSGPDIDIYVLKLSASGACEWARGLTAMDICGPQNGACSTPMSASVSSNGEVAVVGTFVGWIDFGGGQVNANGANATVFVARYAADGSPVTGIKNDGTALARGVGVGFSGDDVIVGGFFASGTLSFEGDQEVTGNNDYDIFFAPVGPSTWAVGRGDITRQELESMATDPSGAILASASFIGELNFGGGAIVNTNDDPGLERDLGIGKLSGTDGTALWGPVGFGPMNTNAPIDSRIAADGIANVILGGQLRDEGISFGTQAVPAQNDANFYVRLTSDGDVLWARAFGVLDGPDGPWRIHGVAGGPAGESALCGTTTNLVNLGSANLIPTGTTTRDIVIGVFEP